MASSKFFVSVAFALTLASQIVTATPYIDDASDISYSATASFGVGAGYGGHSDMANCETDVPVQPTWIHPVTNFIPETNVAPQVNVLPTNVNDFSCDLDGDYSYGNFGSGYGGDDLFGGEIGGRIGDSGYGGSLRDYGYGGYGGCEYDGGLGLGPLGY
ncbi:hypothetical protein BGZ83_001769 [Gryganskiella cystojenkinii]|nr:hypothetical protein BGZ83_001769 [Gryganskiella cystojenkinii]